jgi:hypothetical protein
VPQPVNYVPCPMSRKEKIITTSTYSEYTKIVARTVIEAVLCGLGSIFPGVPGLVAGRKTKLTRNKGNFGKFLLTDLAVRGGDSVQ